MKIGTVKHSSGHYHDSHSNIVVSVDLVEQYDESKKRLVGVKRDSYDIRYFEGSEAIKFAEVLEANVKILAPILAHVQAVSKELSKHRTRSVETADTDQMGPESFDISLYDAENYDNDIAELQVNIEAPCGEETLLTADNADRLAALLRKAAAQIQVPKPKRGKANGK